MRNKKNSTIKCCTSMLFAGTPVLLKSESESENTEQHET